MGRHEDKMPPLFGHGMILRLGHWPCPSPKHRGASLAVPGTGVPFVELGQPCLCMRLEVCGNGLCFKEREGGSHIQRCPGWNQRPLCWLLAAGCSGTPHTQAPTASSLNFIASSLPPGADMDPNPRASLERQQLRLRERQKFFEDILQPETEFVFPLSHLHLEAQRRKSWGEGLE